MKTDLFNDSIRRKLESVAPAYQEKNWTYLQHYLRRQGFPPSVWQTPARWLQPALLAATVAGVVVAGTWQYRANRAISTQIQTLNQTINRLERTQNQLEQSVMKLTQAPAAPGRTDTVYVAINTPANRPAPYPTAPGTLAIRVMPAPERAVGDVPVLAESAHVDPLNSPRLQTTRPPAELTKPGLAPARPTNPVTPLQPTPPNVPDAGANAVSTPTRLAETAARIETAVTAKTVGQRTGNTRLANRLAKAKSTPTDLLAEQKDGQQPAPNAANGAVKAENRPAAEANVPVAPAPAPAQGVLANVALEPLAPLAFATPREAEALAQSWQRHLRRVRFRATAGAPPLAQKPAETATAPARRTLPTIVWRVGVGADVGTQQLGGGVYAEAILANRWTLGTGLSLVGWAGDAYQDERIFTARTKRDFQRIYLPGGNGNGPGPARPREAFDITRLGQAVVIPMLVSYRLPVWKQYVLSPFVGVLLSVAPRETVTFALDQTQPSPRNANWQRLSVDRPLHAYSSWTLGAGLERRWGRVAGQAGPAITLPLSGNGSEGLNMTSVGLQARLFYQF